MAERPLEILVRELLLHRTEGLDTPRLAAYLDGWQSLLELLQRTELLLPGERPETKEAIAAVVERIRASTAIALDDEPD